MGGGHVSRPDFGMPQPDPSHPLTEFYCLLQRALDREGVFALPALYAQFRAPARRIYADEAADFLKYRKRLNFFRQSAILMCGDLKRLYFYRCSHI